jgi:hypothetical protein
MRKVINRTAILRRMKFQWLLVWGFSIIVPVDGFSWSTTSVVRRCGRSSVCHATPTTTTSATTSTEATNPNANHLKEQILEQLAAAAQPAKDYAEQFGLTFSEAGFYAIFDAIRRRQSSPGSAVLGLQGQPFLLRNKEITTALTMDQSPFAGFYTIQDLAQALEDDFLDAARGSTDNRKAWKVRGKETKETLPIVPLSLEKQCFGWKGIP